MAIVRRNSWNTTCPALPIRTALRSRPMKNHNQKSAKEKGWQESCPQQPKNWHDHQQTSGTTTKLDDVNKADNRIPDLTPEYDDINIPFQGEDLA